MRPEPPNKYLLGFHYTYDSKAMLLKEVYSESFHIMMLIALLPERFAGARNAYLNSSAV